MTGTIRLAALLAAVLAPIAIPGHAEPAAERGSISRDTYLDRLRMAEFGGRNDARNPRSSAVGPYQFIASTFLEVARRRLPEHVAGLTDAQILALRTDPAIARLAADAYTSETAAELRAAGLAASYPQLRLAFLLGPHSAIRVLTAEPENPIEPIVGTAVVAANPFMRGMSAGGLVRRAARDIAVNAPRIDLTALQSPAPAKPKIAVQCDLDRPSCRKWLALAEARIRQPAKVQLAKVQVTVRR